MNNNDDIDIIENMTDRELMFYTLLEVKSLKRRMESHSIERQQFSENVYKHLDEIKNDQSQDKEELVKKIQEVELDSVRNDKAVNTKVATISGSFSLVVAIITAWIVSIIMGKK